MRNEKYSAVVGIRGNVRWYNKVVTPNRKYMIYSINEKEIAFLKKAGDREQKEQFKNKILQIYHEYSENPGYMTPFEKRTQV